MSEATEKVMWGQAATSKQILLEGMTPEKVVELTGNAQSFASGMVLDVFEWGSKNPACQKGCAYCCHLHVEASAPEVLVIAEHIRTRWTDEDKEQLDKSIDNHINIV